jgi:hypothetical protein
LEKGGLGRSNADKGLASGRHVEMEKGGLVEDPWNREKKRCDVMCICRSAHGIAIYTSHLQKLSRSTGATP